MDANAWQPIETAPKDCRILLATRCQIGTTTLHRIHPGKWDTEAGHKHPAPYWHREDNMGKRDHKALPPTHWQPMPPPPTDSPQTLTLT